MNKYVSFFIFIFFTQSLISFSQSVKQSDTLAARILQKKARPKPELVRGPYLQVATSNSMMIRWRTDVLSRTVVHYGSSQTNLSFTATDSALVIEHLIKLSGLSPQTKYYYTIGDFKDTLQGDANNYFKTLPIPQKEGFYRIGAFGDCGMNTELQGNVKNQIVNYLGANYMDAWILLGDNAYDDGSDLQYQKGFFNSYKDDLLKKYPLFPAPGNHDYHDFDFAAASAKKTHDIPYYKNFSMPTHGEAGGVPSYNQAYYSFDIGNIHFLSLDSYGEDDKASRLYDTLGSQVQWVKKDLDANKNRQWIIVYFHHPPYTMGSHNSDKENEMVKIRENFIGILERYGVDIILCGHSHNYERSSLMKGYYGPENSFDSSKYNVSQSSGMYNKTPASCPYIKNSQENLGTVYVVSGASASVGRRNQPGYPHNAMPYSDNIHAGASFIEVEGNRLDVKWICSDGIIRDQFTMMKDVKKKSSFKVKKGEMVTLTASFNGSYQWNTGQRTKSIQLKAGPRKSTYVVKDPGNCLEESFEVQVINK